MKKINFLTLFLTVFLTLIITLTPLSAIAAEQSITPNLFELQANDPLLNSSKEDAFIKKHLPAPAKLINDSECYLKIYADPNSTTNSSSRKAYSKSEYIKELQKEKQTESKSSSVQQRVVEVDTDSGKKYSWIKLRLSIYEFVDTYKGNKYVVTGFYTWQREPFVTVNEDIFGISANGLSFDYSTAIGEFHKDNGFGEEEILVKRHTDKSCTVNPSGIAFSIPMADSSFLYFPPGGLIYCLANKTAPSANIVASYFHQEITFLISPSVSIEGATISVSPAFYYDEANYGIQANF